MGLQQGLAKMIKYRDHLVDPDDPDGRADMVLDLETDFSAPDTVYSNRSNLQKMMHLTWDTNGIAYEDIITIPDMLVFWLDSAADGAMQGEGLAEVSVVVLVCPEFSTTHPPAEEVNRFMNHNHDNGQIALCNISKNPVGREGRALVNYNAESLLALEVSGLLDALRPGITSVAVKDRDQERPGTKVLAELLAAIHPHYSSNVFGASPACAELRRLEPMLLDILENTRVLEATVELLASLNGLKTMQGEDVIDELAQFTLFLLEPDQTLLRHDGANWVYGGDGVTQVSPISRLYLLLDALRMLDDAVAGDPVADRAVQTVWDKLYDRFLGVEDTAGLWRFANRRAWTVLLNLVDFLAEKVDRYSSEGTLSQKLAEWERDFADLVGGRTLPRLVDVLHSVAQNPRLPGLLDGLILHLLDGSDPAWLSRMRYELGWYLQWLAADSVTVPAARALAPVIDPRAAGRTFSPEAGQCLAEGPPNTFLSRVMMLADRLSELDCCERDVLAELLLNASQDTTSGPESYPLGVLLDVVGAVHRLDPLDESEKSPQDWANIIGQVSEYLLDGERGVEKLYDIIAHRKGN
ncbi:MAG: hypothetical protein D6806_16525 [Deltaproteobacteria bacterium]|nr:MAG: hypothetical protein D6806_16525 [Deltaproteobacteria bacterium]